MALYRTVHISFWDDPKVVDDFTPEDRLFYLYLLTNPHSTMCGCYEISKRQMATELGYAQETVTALIARFENYHKIIRYSESTKELLVLNWHKYNWTESPKFRQALVKHIESVKFKDFRDYLFGILNGDDTVSIPYAYGIDTSDTVTVTDTVTDTVAVADTCADSKDKKTAKQKKEEKYQAEFEEFWEAYPRKQDRGNAYAKYKARREDGYSPEQLLSAAKKYALECRKEHTERKFIKLGGTFLSDKLPFSEYLGCDNGERSECAPNTFGCVMKGLKDDAKRLYGDNCGTC